MRVESTRHARRAVVSSLAGVAAVAVAVATTLVLSPATARAADPVGLGTAANFSVLAYSTVTNTGGSTLQQALGLAPGPAVVGFPPGTVEDNEIHVADDEAGQAKEDLDAAYLDAAGRTPFTTLGSQLGGRTLVPGVYRLGAALVTGTLTLDVQNDPAAVFIFQIASTLTAATDSSVVFINGNAPCNVFWQVGSSATLRVRSDFVGTIMAYASVTMQTEADLVGRALAQTGAVTLDTNDITRPVCTTATPAPTGPTGTDGPAPTATGPRDGFPPGPGLPITGGPVVPILTAAGTAMVVLGATILILHRRRFRRN